MFAISGDRGYSFKTHVLNQVCRKISHKIIGVTASYPVVTRGKAKSQRDIVTEVSNCWTSHASINHQ